MSVDPPTCLHTGPAPFLPRADPAPQRAHAQDEDALSALLVRGSSPSQWRARALTRGRAALSQPSPGGAYPQPTCGRVDPTPASLARMCARGPHCLPNPACRAHALSALPGAAACALSHAGSEGRWSAPEARAVARCSARRARPAMAARLFSQCQAEPGLPPRAAATQARAGCLLTTHWETEARAA